MTERNSPPSRALVLAGDVGGTKTLLKITRAENRAIQTLFEQRYDSQSYDGLAQMLRVFLDAAQSVISKPLIISGACFAVAGPVTDQQAALTNLPWHLDGRQLGDEFGIASVRLINDFVAVGYGIEALSQQEMVTLQIGQNHECGTRAVLGAGTGLGEGILVWQKDHYEVVASEGGHVDFAPTDEVQIELLRYLMQRYGHVSYERLLSGAGLVDIYHFLREMPAAKEAPELKQAMQTQDPAAAISTFALDGKDNLASQALDLFVSIYGAQAGNLALTTMATGGVYIAGGIAPKILASMQKGGFLSAFRNKGRYANLLSEIPLHVVINQEVGLIGATLAATRL